MKLRAFARLVIAILAVLLLIGATVVAFYGLISQRSVLSIGGGITAVMLFYAILGTYLWSELRGGGYGFIDWRTPPPVSVPREGVASLSWLSPGAPGRSTLWYVRVNSHGIRGYVFLLGETDIPSSKIQRVYLYSDFVPYCVIEHTREGLASPIFTSPALFETISSVLPEKCTA